MVEGSTFQRNCRQFQACSWLTSSSIMLLRMIKTIFPYQDEWFTRIEKFNCSPVHWVTRTTACSPAFLPTEHHIFPAWFCSHQNLAENIHPSAYMSQGKACYSKSTISLDSSPCKVGKQQTHPETVGREPGADDCHFSCCFRKDFASFEFESTSLVTLSERKETNQRVKRQ